MKLKRVCAAFLASVMALAAFSGCGNKESDTFTISTNAAFPPFEYIGDDGKVVGVDIDIAQAIADKMGKELKVNDVEFTSALMSVSSGNVDAALAGITVTDERKKEMDFSDTYATSVQYIIVKADDDSVTTIEDLAGKKVGVQNGTTGNLILDDEINGTEDDDGNHVTGVLEGSGAESVPYKSALLASMDLQTGTVDAVIIDKLPAENIVATNSDLKCFELVYADGSNTLEEYAVAVKKGDTETLEIVNEVIAELKESGKIDEYLLNHTGASKIEE